MYIYIHIYILKFLYKALKIALWKSWVAVSRGRVNKPGHERLTFPPILLAPKTFAPGLAQAPYNAPQT